MISYYLLRSSQLSDHKFSLAHEKNNRLAIHHSSDDRPRTRNSAPCERKIRKCTGNSLNFYLFDIPYLCYPKQMLFPLFPLSFPRRRPACPVGRESTKFLFLIMTVILS